MNLVFIHVVSLFFYQIQTGQNQSVPNRKDLNALQPSPNADICCGAPGTFTNISPTQTRNNITVNKVLDSDLDQQTFGRTNGYFFYTLTDEEERTNIRLKRDTLGLKQNFNETGCYLLSDQKTLTFEAVPETSMKEYKICGSMMSRENADEVCYEKVLYSLHTPVELCKLGTGNTLGLCLVITDYRTDVFMHFYCKIPLEPIHSLYGIVFNEHLYVRHCNHVPIYLTHFRFHMLHIAPFLTDAECKRIRFAKPQNNSMITAKGNSSEIGRTKLSNTDEVVKYYSVLPQIKHMFAPICIMEPSMKNPFFCHIDFKDWKGKMLTQCPPPGCIPADYDLNKTYECIPYIEYHACFSKYIHESGVCVINMTDDTYTVCKALTPQSLQTKGYDMPFYTLVEQCFEEMYPGHEYDNDTSTEFLTIPLDSFSLTPLPEISCMETYRFLLPNLRKAKRVGNNLVVTRQFESVGKTTTLRFITLGFLGFGGISLVVNGFLMRKMLGNEYSFAVVDVYVICAVLSSLPDWIIQFTMTICKMFLKMSNCTLVYVNMVHFWFTGIVNFTLIALCYDRKCAISNPLESRSYLTVKRARYICVFITCISFALEFFFCIVMELETYLQKGARCVILRSDWYKNAGIYMMLVKCLVYLVGWVIIVVSNVILIKELIKNANNWGREFPTHQVVAITVLSLSQSALSLVNALSSIIPVLSLILAPNVATSKSMLDFFLAREKVELYERIFNMCQNLQFLVVGIFLFMNDPHRVRKIKQFFACSQQTESNKAGDTSGNVNHDNAESDSHGL